MRVACLVLPSLPLQILLHRFPEQVSGPAAVVDVDSPQGVVEWVNEAARGLRVLPGMRYAAAHALAPDLFARAIPPGEVTGVVDALVIALRRHTPHVEPATEEPGVFWLDASGLIPLHGSLRAWAEPVGRTLRDDGFQASMVVGFTRFGTYAVARGGGVGLRLFESPAAERAASRAVRLDRLRFEPKLYAALTKLGVRTVDDLLHLPRGGLLQRFGEAAWRLHRLAADDTWAPLSPRPPDPPRGARLALEWPEARVHPLLFSVKRLLDQVLRGLAARGAAVAGLRLDLHLEGKERLSHTLRPATPSLAPALLLDLLRLRLEAQPPLPAGVVEIQLEAEASPAAPEQLRLFASLSRRDPTEGAQALARVGAELGEVAVGRFDLRGGHLPEARFAFVPGLASSDPRGATPSEPSRVLVRRFYRRPLPLPSPGRLSREGSWQPRLPEQGPIVRLTGSHVISGGWWMGPDQHREYAFALTARGDLLWVFYDRRRRRWFECGRIE